MNPWTIHQGDALEVLRTLPDGSAHCCVTSPPYWGLRDYLSCDCAHRREYEGATSDATNKNRGAINYRSDRPAAACERCNGTGRIQTNGTQLGLERTPEEYVEKLVVIFREVRRVLREDGTLWLNLGDSYAGSGPSGASYQSKTTKRRECGNGQDGAFRVSKRIAERGLTYAEKKPVSPPNLNLKPKDLIGIPWRVAFALQADGWWLRSDIIWAKPNPMPESVTDRPTKAHEYIFLLSKSARYYYDANAIREPSVYPDDNRKARQKPEDYRERACADRIATINPLNAAVYPERNKRTVWTVATQPYPESHFAVFPSALIEPCILAGCPASGTVLDCPVGGTVLDPFSGAGTTGLVSLRNGRGFVGIELNPEYVEMAKRRIEDDAPLFNTANPEDYIPKAREKAQGGAP